MAVETREREGATGTTPPLIHSYLRNPLYRRSNNEIPQPGDIARCGWVKRLPAERLYTGASVSCVVCAALKGEAL